MWLRRAQVRAIRQKLLPVLLDLGIGSAGGLAAHALNSPLAWMIGAMVATTAAAVLGLPLAFSRRLRTGMITILGVMLGSAFVPALLDQMARWSFSLAALAVYALVTTALSMVYFRRIARYDPITAYFCAVPGGLNEMTIMGTAMGGNEQAISLTHGARILFTVLTIPIGFRLLQGYDAAARAAASQGFTSETATDIGILSLCAIAGYVLAQRLRLPGGVDPRPDGAQRGSAFDRPHRRQASGGARCRRPSRRRFGNRRALRRDCSDHATAARRACAQRHGHHDQLGGWVRGRAERCLQLALARSGARAGAWWACRDRVWSRWRCTPTPRSSPRIT